jgi:alpha-D-xyloside xylohydrolase
MGPEAESVAAKADPIELRIYPGANGDFKLYEDQGDNYDYEHGVHSVIPIHWENSTGTLTIGDRDGSFPGMLEHRTFHAVVVREGQGTGIAPSSSPDATVEYQGKATSVQVKAGVE